MNQAEKNAVRTPGRVKARTRFAMRGYLWKMRAALPPYSGEVMQGLKPIDFIVLADVKRAVKAAEEHFFGHKEEP